GLHRDRFRAWNTCRHEGQGVQLVREPVAGLAPSRRRPRPFAGALLRRAAWRQGAGGFDRRQGHDRDLRFPDRPGGASRRRRMTASTTFSVALLNETATAQLMADLALLVGPGDVIPLSGDLGAGKTAAARAMIRYLADDEMLEVPSPTFTLVQGY